MTKTKKERKIYYDIIRFLNSVMDSIVGGLRSFLYSVYNFISR